MANNNGKGKSLEAWIWGVVCSIRTAKNDPEYKETDNALRMILEQLGVTQ